MVTVGAVVGTHGVRGEVKVRPDNPDTEAIVPGVRLTLEDATGRRDLRVAGVRPHKRNLLLVLEGVETLSAAEGLVGARVLVPRESLPRLPEGEFYWFEVVGLEAVTEGGERLGRVAEIIGGPGHDVYVLRDGARERLVPAVDEIVVSIDPAAGRMVIRPIEGLWET